MWTFGGLRNGIRNAVEGVGRERERSEKAAGVRVCHRMCIRRRELCWVVVVVVLSQEQ